MSAVRKVLIPAAGFGTRSLPASKAVPKEMLPLVDKPLIQVAVEEAVAAGITPVAIVIAPWKTAIRDHFGPSPALEAFLAGKGKTELLDGLRRIRSLAEITFIEQPEQLGLGHAVSLGRGFAAGEPLAVMNPDTVYDGPEPCLGQLKRAFEAGGATTIVLGRIGREFRWPVFVKPANLGSSVGISKVGGAAEAAGAIRRAFRFDRKIVVEQGLEAREIECSVLGNDRPKASLPGEIFPHRDFYDYRDKYLDNKTTFRIPAELPPETTDRVRRLAVEAFRAVEGSGLARLDFFVDKKSGEVFVNEINTLPGFTEISMYPKLWAATGLPFGRLVEELVRLGFERHRLKKRTAARPSR